MQKSASLVIAIAPSLENAIIFFSLLLLLLLFIHSLLHRRSARQVVGVHNQAIGKVVRLLLLHAMHLHPAPMPTCDKSLISKTPMQYAPLLACTSREIYSHAGWQIKRMLKVNLIWKTMHVCSAVEGRSNNAHFAFAFTMQATSYWHLYKNKKCWKMHRNQRMLRNQSMESVCEHTDTHQQQRAHWLLL